MISAKRQREHNRDLCHFYVIIYTAIYKWIFKKYVNCILQVYNPLSTIVIGLCLYPLPRFFVLFVLPLFLLDNILMGDRVDP